MATDARGRITIDLDAVARNWVSLSNLVTGAECAAVVKADAYGLGAEQTVPVLARAGCRTFFVASFEEGVALQSFVSGPRIFVLDGVFPFNSRDMANANLIPVLSTPPQIDVWRIEAQRRGGALPAALQIDSGLNRLGLSGSEVNSLHNDPSPLTGIDVQLVMSHLASADDPDAEENVAQRDVFQKTRAQLPPAPASLAASDGLMLGNAYHFDLVRPGYALYGGQAFRGRATPVEPVLTVTAKILQIRTVAAGAAIGYSATFHAPSEMKVAIIAAGYADGVPRTASAGNDEVKGIAAIKGQRVPFVGRVSMDLIAVDVTGVDQQCLDEVQEVELIGPTVTLDEVGQNGRTIGYEILTRLSPRFSRDYLTKRTA